MEISGISTYSSYASQASPDQVAVEVEKKAMEIQEQTADEMLDTVPDSSSSKGQNIDVKV